MNEQPHPRKEVPMFGKRKNPPVLPIVARDAAEALPGAREALLLVREAMRYYPALHRTDEFQALQQTLLEMIGDLEELAGVVSPA